MIYKCNEYFTYLLFKISKFYFCFDSVNSKLPNEFGHTIIYFDNLLFQFNDEFLVVEFNNFCIFWYFKKLTNEQLLKLYINNEFISIKNLFSNLYLGVWE